MSSIFPRFLFPLLAAMVFGHAGAAPLVVVTISPESRVKAAEGGATQELVQGEWRDFEIVIDNSAGITSALRIESANVISAATADQSRERWLHLEMLPPGLLTGKSHETRKLRLMTGERGIRSAVLNVNAGQGTQDLGFRSDVLLNFKIAAGQELTRIRGRILDAETKSPMPARMEIRNADGDWFFPTSEGGSAVRYEKRNLKNPLSVENHATLDSHPWQADLPPGRYIITVERGKEWIPLVREITVTGEPLDLELPLKRWVNMASEGWFSGETHVHRKLAELPNVMLAEDLNVAFPLTYWCLDGTEVPFHYDKGANPDRAATLISVDTNHVIWPCNTEWEIFGIGGPTHTFGAVFALGHKTPFKLNAPPLEPVAEEARRQGALLDMDKPDWPWAMALPPVMNVNLFELSNNHVWRVPFALTQWSTPAPEWMLPGATRQGNERDWIEYTHQTYWALLNCGQRLRPSAGTASGVHPVPLGYSRVYVHCPDGFTYENWLAGLKSGRSFVTTGPMCISEIRRDGHNAYLHAWAKGERSLGKIEIIVNGAIYETIDVNSQEATIDREIPLDGTTWIALRVWEPREDGRFRFAHTAPVWFDDASKPLQPRPEQAEFLAQRVRDEISRSSNILPPSAIQEYQNALKEWERSIPPNP